MPSPDLPHVLTVRITRRVCRTFYSPLRTAVLSEDIMNDIPHNTSYARLMNCLLKPSHLAALASLQRTPDVLCGITITDSRLHDELSVVAVVFSDTLQWLQDLNCDLRGFPRSADLAQRRRGAERQHCNMWRSRERRMLSDC